MQSRMILPTSKAHDKGRNTRFSLLYICAAAIVSLLLIVLFTPILDYYEFYKSLHRSNDGNIFDGTNLTNVKEDIPSSKEVKPSDITSIYAFFRGSQRETSLSLDKLLKTSKDQCKQKSGIGGDEIKGEASSIAIFNMKTKMGVTYDGGHWFHMAENFLVQHSILRERDGLAKARTIIFNFDDAAFVDDLNGITMLFVLLGGLDHRHTSMLEFVYFTHLPELIAWGIDGDLPAEIALTGALFSGAVVKVADVRPSVGNVNRFTGSGVTVVTSDASKLSIFQGSSHSGKASASSNDGSVACARFLGAIGGKWPTPQRGHWFPNKGDVDSLRSKFASLCPLKSKQPAISGPVKVRHLVSSGVKENVSTSTKVRKLVIYQRDLNRKLLKQEESIANLRKALKTTSSHSNVNWIIEVIMHKGDRSPCELYDDLQSADVLVTPHGFQSMLLLFMRPHSIVFEVFPYKYFKRAYGPLGREFGVVHGGVMSPAVTSLSAVILRTLSSEYCMSSKQCRNFARNHDVELTVRGVNVLINLINHHDFIESKIDPLSSTIINDKPANSNNINSKNNRKSNSISFSSEQTHTSQSICLSACSDSERHKSSFGITFDTPTCLNTCSIMKAVPY